MDLIDERAVMKMKSELLKAHALNALKGTTTVGIATRNYVVLAADKRATAGHLIAHKKVKKIIKIDERSALTTAGLVADAQALADTLRAEAHYYRINTGKPMKLRSMASLLSLILNSSKYYPYIVQLLLGGYDYEEGPKLFALELFGDLTEEKYTATGSGSPIAIGIIESEYRSDMSLDDCIRLAVKAVASATMRDVYSGEGIDLVVIGQGLYKEYTFTRSDIEKVVGRQMP